MIIETGAKKLLGLQATLISVAAWVFYMIADRPAAQSALFGGCIVMLTVWLTARRLHALSLSPDSSSNTEVATLYAAAIERFFLTVALLALGMGYLKLSPVPMLVTFAIAHFCYFISGVLNTLREKWSS